jgi:hypothetical protein
MLWEKVKVDVSVWKKVKMEVVFSYLELVWPRNTRLSLKGDPASSKVVEGYRRLMSSPSARQNRLRTH